MLKYFKFSNFLLVVLIFVLVYLGYIQFFRQEESSQNPEKQTKKSDSVSEEGNKEIDEDKSFQSDQPPSRPEKLEEEIKTPQPKIGKIEEASEELVDKKTQPEKIDGFYENSTYKYQVKFPREWPLRIRSKEVVSLGYTIPENGRGAVTIEVSEEGADEVEEAKKEAQKYPGLIKISEETVFIDGVQGTKYILEESMSGEKDFYILLDNWGRNYLIKYPGQAEEIDSNLFLEEVEYVLNNFKFISD